MFEHAKRIAQQFDDAEPAMNELKGLEKGEVRLGAPSMMGSYFFHKSWWRLASQYQPEVDVDWCGHCIDSQSLLNGESTLVLSIMKMYRMT